jgi:hypothetical protein
LAQKIEIMPFPRDFFGSPASGSWAHTVLVPDARIASCELFVTNSKGDSEVAIACLTGTSDFGLRTLAGGQLTFQIDSFLAVENGAAPDLYVEATHAVRDVFAIVRQAPLGAAVQLRLKQDGADYCMLTVNPGAKMSGVISGASLPPLQAGSVMSLDVISVGTEAPGSDLNVIIRL